MIPWESCVLWLGYPLQNGVWPDVSKHDNDGIITGAFWESDSIEFDGTDDLVNCGNHSTLDIIDAITIEAWVNAKSSVGTTPIVSKNYGAGKIPYRLYLYNFLPRINSYEGMDLFSARSGTVIDTNTWYHIVGSYDKTLASDNAKIYVNGILKGTDNCNVSMPVNTQPLYVGRYGSAYWDGMIALVRIYNIALTLEQIQEAYEQSYRLI